MLLRQTLLRLLLLLLQQQERTSRNCCYRQQQYQPLNPPSQKRQMDREMLLPSRLVQNPHSPKPNPPPAPLARQKGGHVMQNSAATTTTRRWTKNKRCDPHGFHHLAMPQVVSLPQHCPMGCALCTPRLRPHRRRRQWDCPVSSSRVMDASPQAPTMQLAVTNLVESFQKNRRNPY